MVDDELAAMQALIDAMRNGREEGAAAERARLRQGAEERVTILLLNGGHFCPAIRWPEKGCWICKDRAARIMATIFGDTP